MGIAKQLRLFRKTHTSKPTDQSTSLSTSDSTLLSLVKPDSKHTPALFLTVSDDGKHYPSSQSSSTRRSSNTGLASAADQSTHTAQLTDIKAESLATWLHLRQRERGWTSGGQGEGVMLKRTANEYICWPPDAQNSIFASVIREMDVKVRLQCSF